MVKTLIFLTLFTFVMFAQEYENECLKCHSNNSQMSMFMKQYTLKYSSKERIKEAIFQYLKNPSFETSTLPFGFLNRFGIKEKSTLKDKKLKEMIDIYYERNNIKSKIY